MNIINNITNWLNNRYLIVVRDEDTLEQKRTVHLSIVKLLVLISSFFVISAVVTYFLIFNVFYIWLDPKHEKIQLQKKMVLLQLHIDSINTILDKSITSIEHLKMTINGTNIDSLDLENKYNTIAKNELSIISNYKLKKSQYEKSFIDKTNKDGLGSAMVISNNSIDNSVSDLDMVKTFISPVSYAEISGAFEAEKNHYGIDIVAKEGQAVKSISSGIVILSEYLHDGGETVIVQHKNGFISIYQHNQTREVQKGQKVTTGDVIALMGNTGHLTSGPHLHFELWRYGHPLDPQKIFVFD